MKKIFILFISVLFSLSNAFSQEDGILVFTATKGFYHESIPAGTKCIMEVCREAGINVDITSDASAFAQANLEKYKAVVFLNTTGDVLNEQQQEAFTKYIHSGGGFLGVHAATDTEYDWPWYNNLVGAYFLSHPEQQQATIQVTDKNHPSTSMLPTEWVRTDEWYNFKDIIPDMKVLAYLDETSYKGGANGEKHPFIWYHNVGKGRAFYTGVGHRDDNYQEPLVRQHLLGAIKWAAGVEK